MNAMAFIDQIVKDINRGKRPDRDAIIQMLAIDPKSEACQYLGRAAREIAREACNNQAYLWGAVGIDFRACTMNCHFCSLGEAWGIVNPDNAHTLSDDEIIRAVRDYAENGVRWIVLRTTEFYALDTLAALIGKIRSQVPGSYEIGLNVGEFNTDRAWALHREGVDFIYHSLRMGEGKDTAFDPAVRLKTLAAVKESPLQLVFLVEPIGPEHTNAEIAEICLCALEHQAIVTGAMARIPVKGTPLGEKEQLSDRRLAQIIAVTRLAAGKHPVDICVHPASLTAMQFGANVAVIETGSIPRDTCCDTGEKWHQFDAASAKALFREAGYMI